MSISVWLWASHRAIKILSFFIIPFTVLKLNKSGNSVDTILQYWFFPVPHREAPVNPKKESILQY